MLNNLLQALNEWCFPASCVLCDKASQLSVDLCQACLDTLDTFTNACDICGINLESHSQCISCTSKPPAFTRTVTGFSYSGDVAKMIMAMKFSKKLLYGKILTELFIKTLKNTYQQQAFPELIIAVPLHRERLLQRGYNQSLEIAKQISRKLTIPYSHDYATRTHATKTQSELTAISRRSNMKNAFHVKPLPVKHIALVDDVMTTGSTVNALARSCQHAGAQRIDVWCLARTPW